MRAGVPSEAVLDLQTVIREPVTSLGGSERSRRERFYELDLLRFLAALAVVFFHYGFRGFSADGYSSVRFDELAPFAKYGGFGVNLFFIISGYVILLTASMRDAKGFAVSRITRLFPAYWFAVILTSCCILLIGGGVFHVTWRQFLVNLTMVQEVFNVESVDGVYWTLIIEIKFYLMIFVLLIFRQIKWINIFLYCWCLLSAINLFIPFSSYLEFFLFPKYAPFFVAGCVFYQARKNGYCIKMAVLLVASLILGDLHSLRELPSFTAYYDAPLSPVVVSVIIGSFFLFFFLISVGRMQVINKPVMYRLGILTYPLYLIHQNIGFMVFNASGEYLNRWVLLGGVLVLMIAISFAIHVFIENPVRRWIKASFTYVFHTYSRSAA